MKVHMPESLSKSVPPVPLRSLVKSAHSKPRKSLAELISEYSCIVNVPCCELPPLDFKGFCKTYSHPCVGRMLDFLLRPPLEWHKLALSLAFPMDS
eukprot:2134796-Amphidinium_carterae.1